VSAGRAAAALLFAAGIALLLPWDRIDPAVARLFYRPEFPQGPWQAPAPVPWGMLGQLTTWVAIALAVTGIALLVTARRARRPETTARPALVILIGLALGPGLLVNVLLKDHCHRPRPRQTLGLGGDFHYVAPFRVGPVGKSFPCGHSAVGFACIALAAVVDERRRGARLAVAGGALGLGALLGLGRVATGAHFASDVVWSGILTSGTILAVAGAVGFAERWRALATAAETRDRRGHARRPRTGRRMVAAGLVALAALASALLCFPFRREAAVHGFPLPTGPATSIEARIEVGHARLILGPPGEAILMVESRHDGFGVPWGRIDEEMHGGPEEARGLAWPNRATARYRLAPRGWFADLEGTTTLRLPAGSVGRIEIAVADGHLTLEDESGGAALPAIVCRIRRDALRLRGDLRRDQVEVVER
jgi:lipid A 4'-phosphatase